MNKNIELVKKWLDDSKSVTLAELKANRESAYAALVPTIGIFDDHHTAAAYAACAANTACAADWVRRYEEISK